MSAKILLFQAAPGRFVPRVEVVEQWSRDGLLCWWRVMALDHNGETMIVSLEGNTVLLRLGGSTLARELRHERHS